ncbi:MAG: cobalt chelatase [Firmicutes bacterium HGW-Firmicutes-8]|nr:MAG: cobalt chelatase [Firmicutes bacterium HGW-Firmicutes-8]
MKICAIMWGNMLPTFSQASAELPWLDLQIRSMRDMGDRDSREEFLAMARMEADLLLQVPATGQAWDEIKLHLPEIGLVVPVLSLGFDPSFWSYTTVNKDIAAKANRYLSIGGPENIKGLLCYLGGVVGGLPLDAQDPVEIPWQGIYYPDAPDVFGSPAEYCLWRYGCIDTDKPAAGLLFYRNHWINNNLAVVNCLIEHLERLNLRVIPVFSQGSKDVELGSWGNDTVMRHFFKDNERVLIDVLLDLQSFFLVSVPEERQEGYPEAGRAVLKEFNIPVLHPLMSYYKTEEEWRQDIHGLPESSVWAVSMPEFDGIIEPMVVGAEQRFADQRTGATMETYSPIPERIEHAVTRAVKWVRLKRKRPAERKIALILHNSPCAGLEASVGGGANLDTLASTVKIMEALAEKGYNVQGIPQDGQELIKTIMEKKAVADFRWTPIEEIVTRGGVLGIVSKEQYREWFKRFSPTVQAQMVKTWGQPPGEAREGLSAPMVYRDNILVTGINFGQVVVCVQPKRGCAGAQCNGAVCKILHDPACPPTHQYIATYRFLEEIWGADAVVHIGTHGNLEFLPGKSVGLSDDCYPDLAIGSLPHFYIYNADNPPEGTTAKRRAYAVLIDHLQAVMTESELYGDWRELADYLTEYCQLADLDPARSHALEHVIIDKIQELNLAKEVGLQGHHGFKQVVEQTAEVLSRMEESSIHKGMHIFGTIPRGEDACDFIAHLLRYENGENASLRRVICRLLGVNLDCALDNPGKEWADSMTYGQVLVRVQQYAKGLISGFLAAEDLGLEEISQLARRVMADDIRYPEFLEELVYQKDLVRVIAGRLDECAEIEALLNGLNGGYIESGPAGLISRGRWDVLPTGRNFYAMDPYKLPTRAAWRVGRSLANGLLEKYTSDAGQLPENCGMILFATDMMWSEGEQVAQLLYLLGVEPEWRPNGRVKGLKVLNLEELGRPRIDITVRIGGITRDCFPNLIDLLDEAVCLVAELDEPPEMNYVRKHTLALLEKLSGAADTDDYRSATARIFGSRPGTYGTGVNLAVSASAWENEADLADIFVEWSGYVYGKGIFGLEAKDQLVHQLASVDLTFNKTATDEYDLFGCCCQYAYQGGLTTAAETFSGHRVKSYYGDTRDPNRVHVSDLSDEIARVTRTKLLNPKWIESMKKHGYKGAGDMAKRIGRVYGWEATTRQVDDWVFDDITQTYILDEEMRKWFAEHNPWALEEIGRRLLEAHRRQLWNPDQEVLEGLQEAYLEIEGWMEELMGDVEGEFQGGAIDIMNINEVRRKIINE